jgi:hypothetical protein
MTAFEEMIRGVKSRLAWLEKRSRLRSVDQDTSERIDHNLIQLGLELSLYQRMRDHFCSELYQLSGGKESPSQHNYRDGLRPANDQKTGSRR